jgi:hypothetical protein
VNVAKTRLVLRRVLALKVFRIVHLPLALHHIASVSFFHTRLLWPCSVKVSIPTGA